MEKLRAYWASRDAREQRLLAAGLVLVFLALLYVAWVPLANERERLQRRLPLLQQDVRRMNQLLGSWQASGAGSRQDWLTAAQSRLATHGIAAQQARLVGSTTDSQQWQFEKVEFNRFLDWLAGLYNEFGVRVKSISITPEGAGAVSVKLELTRA